MSATALRWDGWARSDAVTGPIFSQPSRPSIGARKEKRRQRTPNVTTIRLPVALLDEAGLPSSPGSRVNLHRDDAEIHVVPGVDFMLCDRRCGEATLLTLQLTSERLAATPFRAVKVAYRVQPQLIALTLPAAFQWRDDA